MASVLRRAVFSYMRSNARSSSASASGEHHGDYKMWKNLSFFVAFPAIGLGMVNAYLGHIENPHARPEFVPYDYLRVRTKRFPWGDGNHSLIHNPHVNALPNGYEDVGHH